MFSESDFSLRKSDVKDRRLSIIDFSSADDSLLDPVSENSLNHQRPESEDQSESWYTPNSKKFEDAATKIEQWEQERQTSEAGKSKKNNTKCNLRKSLAWDTAFFTSAGVLDAEELSSIMEGVEKEELPRIEEDVYKSCDSISTLASDSLTLESVEMEGDLFEDVRASIQKSSNKSKLANAPTRVSSASGLPGFQTRGDTSKKVGMVSRIKVKAPPASKNPSAGIRGIGKITTKNNFTSAQLPPPVATRRESSFSKQSKLPVRPSASSTISSKRVSIGDLHAKSEKDKAKQILGDRVSQVSKASVIGTVPRPTVLSKSTSGPSVSIKTKAATSTSSGSNLSDNIGKSPCNSSKRKVNTGTLKPPPSRAPVRTPSRFASRSNTESGHSSLSSMMSSNKLSSSISPASSVSDFSSESSVSTSMPKRMCDSSRSSIDSSSSSKVLSDTIADQGINSQIPQSDLSLNGQEAQHTGFISQSVRNASVATVIPLAPGKPSGLRLPSPKIGFFDGAKSSVRTPRGGMQPHSAGPHGLPKHGASPSEGQNKAKLGKLQPVRNITPVGNKKPEKQQNSRPTHFHESLDVAIKTSIAEQNVKSSSEMPMGAVENVEYTSPSHPVEKTHNLHPPTGVNKPENVHDIQVDCLSKQVGRMDINSKTCEKINGDSLSVFQTDVSFKDKSSGLELSSHNEVSNHPKNQESLKGSSTSCLSLKGSSTPTRFDMATSIREPFAVKDSFCNMDCGVFTESIFSEVKPTNLPVPESITKETAEII